MLYPGGSGIAAFSRRMAMNFIVKGVIGVVVLASFVSCAAVPDRGQGHGNDRFAEFPTALKKAYEDYWETRAEKQHENAYSKEVPDFRAAINLGQYSNYLKLFEGAELKQVEPKAVTCVEGQVCYVETELVYVLGNGTRDVRQVRDCWEEWNGRWFHRIRNPLIFPGLDKPLGNVNRDQ